MLSLPLRLGPQKKRKSSAIEDELDPSHSSHFNSHSSSFASLHPHSLTMFTAVPLSNNSRNGSNGGSNSGGTSGASGNGAGSNTRFLAVIFMLIMFMFFTMSSTSMLNPSTSGMAASVGNAQNMRGNNPNNNNMVHTVRDPTVLGEQPASVPNRPMLRQETPKTLPQTLPSSFGLIAVADLDKKSKDTEAKKPRFFSYLAQLTLKIDRAKGSSNSQHDKYSVEFGEVQRFTTPMNEAGRGFELSELQWFNHKLYSFDDRTGIVFRLQDFEGIKPIKAFPEFIVMEGDGLQGKGQKHEWATVKDGEMFIGSHGKEFIDSDGTVISDSMMWVAVLGPDGSMRHEDWTANFGKIRKAMGIEKPGYVIHESVEWSDVHRKWFFLPRRVSKDPYNDELDETRGSNKMVIASEDFSTIEVREIGTVTPLRGFSSFKFLPFSEDKIIVAIKSVEIEAKDFQTSYVTVFDIEGNELLEETEFTSQYKFEGLAFVKDWSA